MAQRHGWGVRRWVMPWLRYEFNVVGKERKKETGDSSLPVSCGPFPSKASGDKDDVMVMAVVIMVVVVVVLVVVVAPPTDTL